MIFKEADKILVKDYVEALQETERVLWESPMGFDPEKEHDGKFSLSSCSTTALFWGAFFDLVLFGQEAYSPAFLLLFFIVAPLSISFIYQKTTYKRRHKKIHETQYLLSSKGIIFIVHHDNKIHINQLPYSNIKKVLVGKNKRLVANIMIIPKEKTSFRTYNYWNDAPSHYLTMFHVLNADKAAEIINKNIFS